MEIKVGDKLTVKSVKELEALEWDGPYQLYDGIYDYADKEVTISEIRTTNGLRYFIEGYARAFLKEFFVIEEEVEYDGQINGFTKTIEEFGRVTVPIEFRRALDITRDDYLDMRIINKVIHLVKGSGRQLDKLGRYTIPIEFRKHLGIVEGSQVDVYVDGEELCIKKISVQCVDCGSTEKKLFEHNGVLLCEDCIKLFFGKVAFNG